MNLHDWIDELCDALDIDLEFDEGLVQDVARLAADRVQVAAGPVSAFLLGFAAGQANADEDRQEVLASRAIDLANRWEGEEDLEAELELEVELDAELEVDGELVDVD